MNINLLQKKEKGALADKLLYFALHYLRYIIVLTQITVIAVFFYRFSIDQQIIDLKEKVAQKQEIIKITTPLVSQAKAVESKISQIKLLVSKQSNFNDNLGFVLSTVPEEITLTELVLDNKQLSITGQSVALSGIKNMYNRLKKDKRFKNIAVSGLNQNLETKLFEFSLIAKL